MEFSILCTNPTWYLCYVLIFTCIWWYSYLLNIGTSTWYFFVKHWYLRVLGFSVCKILTHLRGISMLWFDIYLYVVFLNVELRHVYMVFTIYVLISTCKYLVFLFAILIDLDSIPVLDIDIFIHGISMFYIDITTW